MNSLLRLEYYQYPGNGKRCMLRHVPVTLSVFEPPLPDAGKFRLEPP